MSELKGRAKWSQYTDAEWHRIDCAPGTARRERKALMQWAFRNEYAMTSRLAGDIILVRLVKSAQK